MNSITRPRKRCRVKSVNFKVFAWLLIHEAYFRIVNPNGDSRSSGRIRSQIATRESSSLQADARWFLKRQPSRRFLP